jgi:hypothetical protein
MNEIVYTLKQKKGTDEFHLFKGKMTAVDKCTSEASSICNKMSGNESVGNRFTCESEDSARLKCAEIGRQVCGTCVSSLYTTYD